MKALHLSLIALAAIAIIGTLSFIVIFESIRTLPPQPPPNDRAVVELHSFGQGILEYNINPSDFCNMNTKIGSGELDLRNIEWIINKTSSHLFVVVAGPNHGSYLHAELPNNNNSSYLVKLYNGNNLTSAGLYQGYQSIAWILQSGKTFRIDESVNYKQFLYIPDYDISYIPYTIAKGQYRFHALVFNSDVSNWINHDTCATRIDWQFLVDESGRITSGPLLSDTGKLSDVTKEFPPLQQHKKGVNFGNIECRHGFQLISKAREGTPACVSDETESKLIQRGWARVRNFATITLDPMTDADENRYCLSIKETKERMLFLKIPSYLPPGYEFKCGTPFSPNEVYVFFWNQPVDKNNFYPSEHELWKRKGSILLHIIDNSVINKENGIKVNGTSAAIEEYNSILKDRPELKIQLSLVDINGNLAVVNDWIDGPTLRMHDGNLFIWLTGTSNIPPDDLVKIAKSLQ
ncbi:MAG: hypothetical protein ACT4N5_05445 [Nitrosopumilaceae archaeon]